MRSLGRLSLCVMVAFCVVLASQSAVLAQTTLTLQEGLNGYSGTKDAFIRSDYATANHGGRNIFIVKGDSDIYNPLVCFTNLNSLIGSGQTIVSATLKLHEYSGTVGSVSAYRVLKDWVEGTGGSETTTTDGASWTYTDGTTGGTTWQTAGASGATDRAAVASDTDAVSAVANWLSLDVTADVQGFYAGTYDNYGWILTSSVADQRFYSSDNTDPDKLLLRPILEVVYTPEPATIGLLALGAIGLAFRRRRRG